MRYRRGIDMETSASRTTWLAMPLLTALLLFAPPQAHAQPPSATATASTPETPSPEDEVAALEATLAQRENQATTLASDDCAAACHAWQAMRRAAERICELAPGERCDAARARVERSRHNLVQACPACSAAVDERQHPAYRDLKKESGDASPPTEPSGGGLAGLSPGATTKKGDRHDEVTASAPISQSARGGCAACSLPSSSYNTSAGGLAWLLLAALGLLRRGRR